MAFDEYGNDPDPIAHYDDRYADMRSEFNSSLVTKVAKKQNTIYGQNGEPYQVPIKGADLIGLESFLKRLLYSDEMPYRIKRVQGVEYGYPLPMAVDIKRLSAYGRIRAPLQGLSARLGVVLRSLSPASDQRPHACGLGRERRRFSQKTWCRIRPGEKVREHCT
ncbi:hypothetical protein [Bordetella trematum]|uniref:hypothetical protein n=1 Tax=Bordetella trematum TaxID=123899 RepID=UPI003AF40507